MSVPTERVVAIQGKYSNRFLDGRYSDNDIVLMSTQSPFGVGVPNLNWSIRNLYWNIFVIQNISSNGFLDGRSQDNEKALVTNRYPDNDTFLQWRIF